MPLQKLIFKPGVNREGTTLTNEGSWFETDKVRFRSGFPEKIGGWVALSTNTFMGVCRSLWNWVTLQNFNLLGVGTNQKFYIENGGTYNDITPLVTFSGGGTLTDISVTNGSYEATITVSSAPSYQTGDIISISGVTNPTVDGSFGGVDAAVFNQQYQVIYVSGTQFKILLREVSAIEAPAAYESATSTATYDLSVDTSGGDADVEYLLPAGLPIYTVGTGWGVGAWSRGGWGSGAPGGAGVGLQLRLWSQANFGENLLINPRGGAIYYWAPGAAATPDYATRAALITTADDIPAQVNQIMVSDATRIVIAFGCTDYLAPIGTGVFDPMLIRWTTAEDYDVWLPDAANQAGSYRLSHGSEIISALQTRQEILIWTDAAVYSMQYLGPPYVWGFNILADNISLISPNAVATANGMVFWMGVDKFYAYSGRVETLPSALRQYVFQDINKDQAYQVFAATNEGYSEVWWFYCSSNSDVIDKYVVYNYLDNVWHYGSMNRTAWADSALRPYPQATSSVQNTLVTGSAVQIADTQIQVDNSSSFPDSGYIQIGDEVIHYTANDGASFTGCTRGQFSTTAATHALNAPVTLYGGNSVLYHEFGNDDVSVPANPRPIPAFIQSSDIDLDDGDRYMFVWQMVPDFSFDGSTTPSPEYPQVQVQLRPRRNPGSSYGSGPDPDVSAATSYATQNTYTVQEFTELVNTRIRGRQVALRVSSNEDPTNTLLGTKWQLGAMRVNMRPDGRR